MTNQQISTIYKIVVYSICWREQDLQQTIDCTVIHHQFPFSFFFDLFSLGFITRSQAMPLLEVFDPVKKLYSLNPHSTSDFLLLGVMHHV